MTALDPVDADALFAIRSDVGVVRYGSIPPPPSIDEAHEVP